MIRPIAFCVGLALAWYGTAEAQTSTLCIDGHPAKRSEDVRYGGLPTLACCERDHIRPLCLGGHDTLANLQYQPWAEARRKDGAERAACERVCAGKTTALQEREQFHREWGNDPTTAPQREAAEAPEGISRPEDATKVEIDDLKERVTQLEGLLKALLAFLPDCTGEPPERMPCLERNQ